MTQLWSLTQISMTTVQGNFKLLFIYFFARDMNAFHSHFRLYKEVYSVAKIK